MSRIVLVVDHEPLVLEVTALMLADIGSDVRLTERALCGSFLRMSISTS